jgi:hypothetical protein
MTAANYAALIGMVFTSWALGFAFGYSVLTFRRAAEEASS